MVKIMLSLYGVILLSGAYFGFKAGSKISLVMGIVSGIFVFIGIYMTKTNPTLGYKAVLTISSVLSIVFLIRLLKTQNFMPSGMLLILSLLALVVCLKQIL